MTLTVQFRVHNVTEQPIASEVELNGEKMDASISGVEVELAGVHAWDGAPKLRFAGAEAVEARKIFKRDAVIDVEFDESMSSHYKK